MPEGAENQHKGQKFSKIWSPAPRVRSLLPPGLLGRKESDGKSRSLPTSAFLPANPAPTPPIPSRGCGQGQHRGLPRSFPTLTPSLRPECELHGACPPMPQGLEGGNSSLGAKIELTYINPRGNTVSSVLSAILEGRHHATLRLFPASSTMTSHPAPGDPRVRGRL